MWKVIRHSGRKNDNWKVKYEGEREIAAGKYDKLRKQIKQGSCAFVSPNGEIIARTYFYNK